MLDLPACVSMVLYYTCRPVVLLKHGEVEPGEIESYLDDESPFSSAPILLSGSSDL